MSDSSRLTCAIVVAFLNEASYLPTFLETMEAQSQHPDRLLLVDDGSTDASPEIAEEFARERPWVKVLRREKGERGKDRLTGSPEFVAFLWGREQLEPGYDVIAKMDADLRLAPSHVERVLERLEADPSLGITGTWLWARDAEGHFYMEPHAADHVRGPTRFYRSSCLEQILPLPSLGGWDGADEVRARDRGWTTRSFEIGARTEHMRPTGMHDGRLRAYARWGSCAYALGTPFWAVLISGAIRFPRPPLVIAGLAYVYGWARALVQRDQRFPDDVRRATRREWLARVRRRGAPAQAP